MRSRLWAWVGAAFVVNLFLAAAIVLALGTDTHGIGIALRVTARVSFFWFWAAYTGGALTTLFGAAFLPLKQHGRELGLAFAAALSVHLALVAWLCWMGVVPQAGVFIFFGTAAALTFVLAIFSFGDFHAMLGPKGWRLLRIIAMNFVLYAFLKDFMHEPLHGGVVRVMEYLPFVIMAIAALLLQFAAWAIRLRVSFKNAG